MNRTATRDGTPELDHREHAVEGDLRIAGRLFVHRHAVDYAASCQLFHRPRQVGRVDAVHSGAGANDRVEAEDGLVRVLVRQAADEVYLRADGKLAAGRALRDRLDDE